MCDTEIDCFDKNNRIITHQYNRDMYTKLYLRCVTVKPFGIFQISPSNWYYWNICITGY